MNKLYIAHLCIWIAILTGCSHHDLSPEINVELYGKWSNDGNCTIILTRQDIQTKNSIKIAQFTNSKGTIFNNVNLTFRKDGIYTVFYSTNTITNLKIMYVEGTMIIDQYCSMPLHKVNQ